MACGRGHAVVGPTGLQDAARESVWRDEGAAFCAHPPHERPSQRDTFVGRVGAAAVSSSSLQTSPSECALQSAA